MKMNTSRHRKVEVIAVNEKKQGFTLVELIITVAISSMILMGLMNTLKLSLDIYQVNLEINECMTKINPFLKRIEIATTESTNKDGLLKVPEITDYLDNGSVIGITVKQSNGNSYKYYWNKSKKSLFRSNEDNSNVHLLFNSRNVTVENFEVHFFITDNNFKTIEINNPANANYIRFDFELKGKSSSESESSEFIFSSGYRLP